MREGRNGSGSEEGEIERASFFMDNFLKRIILEAWSRPLSLSAGRRRMISNSARSS